MVVCLLTHCTLLHSMCDSKATQMNVQHHLIQEFLLYKFKLGHDATEATKNICCMKSECTVIMIFQMVQEILLVFPRSRQSGKVRVDSKFMLQAIELNSAGSSQKVTGKLSISQSSMVQQKLLCTWNQSFYLAINDIFCPLVSSNNLR